MLGTRGCHFRGPSARIRRNRSIISGALCPPQPIETWKSFAQCAWDGSHDVFVFHIFLMASMRLSVFSTHHLHNPHSKCNETCYHRKENLVALAIAT